MVHSCEFCQFSCGLSVTLCVLLPPPAILYELLYDDVFKVDRSNLGLCQRVGRPSDLPSDDSMAACGSSDESDPDAGEELW